MLVGTYRNKNFINSPIGPRVPDKLILYKNNRFISDYWGKGKYEISYSLKGTSIYLDYDENTGLNTRIERSWFGKPRIIIFSDLEHFYQKSN